LVFALISKRTSLVSKSITIAAFFANDAEVIKIKSKDKEINTYLKKFMFGSNIIRLSFLTNEKNLFKFL
jgi:hypothetical protein